MTEHLITRRAALSQCVRCGNLTITGISGGLTTVVDTKPLSISDEISALITGKATFDLMITGQAIYLEWRDVTRIRAGRTYPVVTQHPCAAASSRPLPPPPAEEVPDDPPF